MKHTKLALVGLVACITLFTAGVTMANVPAPPANQLLGIDDGIFNSLQEADCRVCHDDPNITGPTSNVDRHHLLYGTPLPQGECSVNRNPCSSNADCDPDICSQSPVETCSVDTDCDNFSIGEFCGEVCIGESVVPDPDADNDGTADPTYGCLNCHQQSTAGGIIEFLVERDCLACHVQVPGEGSVHHLTDVAQGRNSPIGDPDVGDCTPCHGTLVDDIGDGHAIPTYNPSLVTPAPSGGDGEPLNSLGNGAGACDYCHDAGIDTITGGDVTVFANDDTHHNTGLFLSETGVVNDSVCFWCHLVNPPIPDALDIRVCEGCHGYESLHNIQVDSPNSANPGTIVVGGEDAGYGHIGRDAGAGDSDCWGCHGYTLSAASAVASGPVVPFISGSDVSVMTTGTDTLVTLTGVAFTNMILDFQWVSDVLLTAADGSSVMLTPETISEGSLTVTIPGTTAPGNYTLQAVKDALAASNPVALSIKPAVVITEIDCSKCLGAMTITGSGFSEKPEGTDEDLYVIEGDGGRLLKVISWTDTEIKVLDARCRGDVTVNTIFGAATAQ